MKTNMNMLKYRESMKVKLDELYKELEDVQNKLKEAIVRWTEEAEGVEDYKERMKIYQKYLGDLPRIERNILADIEEAKMELLEKKYANLIMYSDIKPFEVVEERTPNLYLIREMDAVITDKSKKELQESFSPGGFCGHFDNDLQEWHITSNEEYPVFKIRRHKDGCFYSTLREKYSISHKPIKFYDYNF